MSEQHTHPACQPFGAAPDVPTAPNCMWRSCRDCNTKEGQQMTTHQKTAPPPPLDRRAAASLAGKVKASLGAAIAMTGKPDKDDPAYALHEWLVRARESLGIEIENAGWTDAETWVARCWSTEQRQVADLETDDHFWHDEHQCWYEVRDVWGQDDADPASENHLGPDHPDLKAIREIIEGSVGYSRCAVRVVDLEESCNTEIVCKVLPFDSYTLVRVQVLGVGRG